METFTAIKIEAYINSAWADLTPDVQTNPAPRVSGMGYSSHNFDDVVGDPATFTFSLDNSAACSGGVLGYYSPQGINRRTGWGVAVPVRLYFQYDGYTVYKFYGYIDNDGITVETGRYAGRKVHVRASNWLKWAAEQNLALMEYKTNMRIDQGVYEVLNKCSRQPLTVRYSQGDLTFPTLFDGMRPDTKAISELQKLAISELGRIYISGGEASGEILHIKNKDWITDLSVGDLAALNFVPTETSQLTDKLLMETGDEILEEGGGSILLDRSQQMLFYVSDGAGSYNEVNLRDVQVSYGKYMFNRARVTAYPRTVDAAVGVLWNSEEYITLAAGESITIRGQYRNNTNPIIKANGIEMVTPVITTDYLMFANSDGTGTNRSADLVVAASFGTAEVELTLTNNNAATSYVTFLQVRGKGVYLNDPTEKVYNSTTYTSTFGIIPKEFDFPYVANMQDLFTFASKSDGTMFSGGIFTGYDKPLLYVDSVKIIANVSQLGMMSFLFGEPGKQMLMFEKVTNGGSDGGYGTVWGTMYIRGYSFEIVNGKTVNWYPTLTSSQITF